MRRNFPGRSPDQHCATLSEPKSRGRDGVGGLSGRQRARCSDVGGAVQSATRTLGQTDFFIVIVLCWLNALFPVLMLTEAAWSKGLASSTWSMPAIRLNKENATTAKARMNWFFWTSLPLRIAAR